MAQSQMMHSAVRLSRNLRGIPFPQRLNDLQKARLTEELSESICHAVHTAPLDLSTVSQARLYSLAEQQIIDPEHAKSPQGKAVLCSSDGMVFIDLNCDNHLELVAHAKGDALHKAYARVRTLDETLERIFPYAFDDEFGFLSPFPTDIGTGMEATLYLHLPMLKENRRLLRMVEHLSRLGFLLHGSFGSGSEAKGAFYQLTNRVTLGLTETETLDNLSAIARQLVQQEADAEQELHRNGDFSEPMNRIAQLKQARAVSLDDGIQLLSDMRLCGALGLSPSLSDVDVDDLLYRIQPATLLSANLQCTSVQELDCIRADLLRTALCPPVRADHQ